MNKEQSNTRKINRSKTVKTFSDQVEKETEKRKKAVKEMPIWKKIVGITIIPLMLCIWWIDRAMFMLMPHATHPSLKNYLLDKSSLKMTFARMLIFGIPAFIVWIVM